MASLMFGLTQPEIYDWQCISPQPESENGNEVIPSVRYGHSSLQYQDEMIITHGYYYSPKKGSCYLNDTWAFNHISQTWRNIQTSYLKPSSRFKHNSIMDETNNRLYIFGGTDGGERNQLTSYTFGPKAEMNDLWFLDLENIVKNNEEVTGSLIWKEAVPNENSSIPSPRCDHGLVWARDQVWLFGGLQGNDDGTADGLRALGDLWSWSPETHFWTNHTIEENKSSNMISIPEPRYGHACIAGRRNYYESTSSSSANYNIDGFFILGGRHRNIETGNKDIINDFWWCEISQKGNQVIGGYGGDYVEQQIRWYRLETPCSPEWKPRFNFASTEIFEDRSLYFHQQKKKEIHPDNNDSRKNGHGSFVVFGGNVSTGLLRLPPDAWLYDDSSEDDGDCWKRITSPESCVNYDSFLPYGRVHSTITHFPSSSSSRSSRLLLFGGESTRPYMYHSSVYQINLFAKSSY